MLAITAKVVRVHTTVCYTHKIWDGGHIGFGENVVVKDLRLKDEDKDK